MVDPHAKDGTASVPEGPNDAVATHVPAPKRSLFQAFADKARDALTHVDADLALQASMAGCIELAATRHAVDPGPRWEPGRPLKLLFAGYAGSRNTGADIRVDAMIRQFRHLLGDELAELSILTIDPALTRGYFHTARQITLPKVFPRFMMDAVRAQHGVIACEGSMFKSKFANALATLMVGGLGLAAVENKIAVGYGGEAGAMDPSLEAMVRRYCRDALILARNVESREVLARLGIESRAGTDTAWTYASPDPTRGARLLEQAGWDGRTPVLAVCPINPFWWPVKPDVLRGAARWATGAWADQHYASVYFHHHDARVQARQDAYLDALADGIRAFMAETPCFPVLVGMEMLDRRACEALNRRFDGRLPLFVSDEHDMHGMVGVLRASRWILSSRYHAIVCSMGGGVASAGVTMDERIRNLMADRGTPGLALEVDDPDLGPRVLDVLRTLRDDEQAVQDGIRRCVGANLVRMGQMGVDLVDHLRSLHPELPIDARFGSGGAPLDHLPPLHSSLHAALETL